MDTSSSKALVSTVASLMGVSLLFKYWRRQTSFMRHVLIRDPDAFEAKKQAFIAEGATRLQVISGMMANACAPAHVSLYLRVSLYLSSCSPQSLDCACLCVTCCCVSETFRTAQISIAP
jgi:hypothetical protein